LPVLAFIIESSPQNIFINVNKFGMIEGVILKRFITS
jgi:hypothetical protein